MKHIMIAYCLFLLMSCSDNNTDNIFESLPKGATILAFGDSLTYGTGTGKTSSYPAILEKMTGMKVINEGIPGEISQEGLQRLPAVLDAHQPKVLILVHGANDILRKINNTQIADNLKAMITLAKQRDINVLMLGVPSFSLPSLESAIFYEQLAKEENIPIDLDILPQILSSNELKSDNIHPNTQGYQMMAEAVYNLLQKSGAIK